MQSLEVIHNWQLGQLKNAINILRYIISSVSNEDATTYRDGGDGWTVLEVLGHLEEFEGIFIERIQLTLNTDNPELPNRDQDKQAEINRYNEADMDAVLADWIAKREQLLALYDTIEPDQWERPARHPRRGPFTLNDQLALTVWHDMNHFEQIARILLEKQ